MNLTIRYESTPGCPVSQRNVGTCTRRDPFFPIPTVTEILWVGTSNAITLYFLQMAFTMPSRMLPEFEKCPDSNLASGHEYLCFSSHICKRKTHLNAEFGNANASSLPLGESCGVVKSSEKAKRKAAK